MITVATFYLTLSATGTWKNGTLGERCYIDENGVQLKSKWFSVTFTPKASHVKLSITWYYFNEDRVFLYDGWEELDGNLYKFGIGGNLIKKVGFSMLVKAVNTWRRWRSPLWMAVSGTFR